MKIQYLLILIVFLQFNVFYGQIQNAKITYKVKMHKKNPDKKLSKMLSAVVEESKNLEMELLLKSNKSTFKEKESMDVDDKNKNLRKLAKVVTGLNSSYYYNLSKKIIVREKEFDGVNYNITSNFGDFTWKLLNQKKNINLYECHKAVGTKTYTSRKGNIITLDIIAWYTPNIPIPLGPKNYVGLPGLILELNEGNNKIYYATVVNLSPKDFSIIPPKEGEIITEKEYQKRIAGSTQKWINSMKN